MSETNPAVIKESQIHKQEAAAEQSGKLATLEDSSDESDGDWEDLDAEDPGNLGPVTASTKKGPAKEKKTLGVVDKAIFGCQSSLA
jgi:hypothetical protein